MFFVNRRFKKLSAAARPVIAAASLQPLRTFRQAHRACAPDAVAVAQIIREQTFAAKTIA
ncbi:MAG TPA: hypothetical protein VKU37_14855 [Verrucomicrobiae bacterium]|nr:hypothetical protein [Verrucomicrobiae bacterium]